MAGAAGVLVGGALMAPWLVAGLEPLAGRLRGAGPAWRPATWPATASAPQQPLRPGSWRRWLWPSSP